MNNPSRHRVTVLKGDGIGSEVVSSAIKVINASGLSIDWDFRPIGDEAREKTGRLLPNSTVVSIARNKIALKGPTGTPSGGGHKSLNVRLRQQFDLFANIRPVKSVIGVNTPFSDRHIDILIFRENTEGEYAIKEKRVKDGVVGTWLFTTKGCARIARYAFETAQKENRHSITVVAKPNIFKLSHGLFVKEARKVAKDYPEIKYQELIADNCVMQIVRNPERFDCILTTNFLGDLISDECAGLVGGLGFAPGANIGEDCAIFEAVHGTAPDIVGKGISNPSSIILSSVMMLRYLNEADTANRIEHALAQVIELDGLVTPDGRVLSSEKFTDAIISRL